MPQTIYPALRYVDANAALEWLARVFGCREHFVVRGDDGSIHHAQLRLGASVFMLGQDRSATTAAAPRGFTAPRASAPAPRASTSP